MPFVGHVLVIALTLDDLCHFVGPLRANCRQAVPVVVLVSLVVSLWALLSQLLQWSDSAVLRIPPMATTATTEIVTHKKSERGHDAEKG